MSCTYFYFGQLIETVNSDKPVVQTYAAFDKLASMCLQGQTDLMRALDLELANMLLDAGANVNTFDARVSSMAPQPSATCSFPQFVSHSSALACSHGCLACEVDACSD